MAGGLDELIEFLLGEIGLGGERGLDFSQLVSLVRQFYTTSQDARPECDSVDKPNYPTDLTICTVDRPFIAQIWRWLGRHPDVAIGKAHEYDHKSLDDVENKHPGYTVLSSNNQDGDNQDSVQADGEQTPASLMNSVSAADNGKKTASGPHIYVNEDRMSIAICGHPPDPTRVFAMEWKLLLHIAAAGRKGMLQGELVQASGQDKRSVPKRTDALHEKGYIEKKSIYLKGNKTSHLFLRRFADTTESNDKTDAVVPAAGQRTVRHLIRQLFEVLKYNPLIPQEHLASALGMTSIERARALSLLIKHFGRNGCLKRVKTAFGPAAKTRDLETCISYLNDPTDQNIKAFDACEVDELVEVFVSKYETAAVVSRNPDSALEPNSAEQVGLEHAEEDCVVNLRTVLPSWNPDRILANALYEAAANVGTSGLKNTDARNLITGPFVKRTLESLLAKISHRSLQAQPTELRHLALLRTQEFCNGVLQYVHYSFDAFVNKVLNGVAGWTDVSGGDLLLHELRKIGKGEQDISTKPATDTVGFAIKVKSTLQESDGRATMARLLEAVRVRDNVPRTGEPMLRETAPGIFTMYNDGVSTYVNRPRGIGKTKRSKPQDAAKATKKAPPRSDSEDRPMVLGRPRKFAQGLEKYWREVFVSIVQQIDPGRIKKSGKKGITTDARALKIYRERPPTFDETVLQAMSLGLPITYDPENINQRWVDYMDAIINRSGPGLYITPVGYHMPSRKRKAQTVILRSSGLKDLDLSERPGASFQTKFRAGVGRKVPRRQNGESQDKEQPHDPPPRGIFMENVPIFGDATEEGRVSSGGGNAEDGFIEIGDSTDATSSDVDNSCRASDAVPKSSGTGESARRADSGPPHASQERDKTLTNGATHASVPLPSKRPSPERRPIQKAANHPDGQNLEKNDDTSGVAMTSPGRDVGSPEAEMTSPFMHLSAEPERQSPFDGIGALPGETIMQVANLPDADPLVSDDDIDTLGDQPLDNTDEPASGQLTAIETVFQIPSTTPDPEMITEEPDEVNRTSQKRSLAVFREPTNDADHDSGAVGKGQKSPNPKRRKQDGETVVSRPQVAKLCRILILELLGLCSGLVPGNPSTLKRAMWPRWREAGVKSDQLTVKTIRAAIKALCSNGKCKQITFAFRGRTGAMTRMSILALQSMHTTSTVVLDLQKKMIDAVPGDYTPPELEAEALRAPIALNRRRYAKELELYEFAVSPRDVSKVSKKRKSNREANPPAASSLRLEPDKSPSPESVVIAHNSFITLRVPRLKELNLPSQDYQFKYKPPPPTLRFDAEQLDASREDARTTPIFARKIGLRRKRGTRFDPETHKLVWKKPPKSKLPSCLDDVPNIRTYRDEAALRHGDDRYVSTFDAEVDCVAYWEEKSASTLIEIATELPMFINHTIPAEALESPGAFASIEFKALLEFNDSLSEGVEVELPETTSWAPFVAALRNAEQESLNPLSRPHARRSRKPAKRRADNDDAYTEDERPDGPAAKKRKQTPREPKLRRSRRTKMKDHEPSLPTAPFRRNRVTQLLRYLSEEEKYQIAVAVVTVRTLAGGIEKFVDWRLVCRLLPAYEEQNLREAWKSMLNRYRNDVVDLTESLQHSYIEALAQGIVPTVNFDAVHTTDWEGIYRWALKNLSKSIIKRIEDLPATRHELLCRSDYIFEEHKGVRDVLGYNFNITGPRKEECLSGVVFGKALQVDPGEPVGPRHVTLAEQSDVGLLRAKTWIVATLLTPESSFSPEKIQQKLLTLTPTLQESEALVERALKCLQRDRLASRMKRIGIGFRTSRLEAEPRFNKVSSFELSSKFFEQFEYRRMVTPAMLRQAATYKVQVLDPLFSKGGSLVLARDTILEDGEVVAILNLFSMGMLRITPGDNVPANLWGLEWEKHGYTTRMIDKKCLSFSVVLSAATTASQSYVSGDPASDTRRMTAIPRGEIDRIDGLGYIPVWFDINHAFQPRLWEMVLGAVLGLVSTRPGIDAHEISRTVGQAIDTAQADLVLQWAEDAGLVKKTGSGLGWDSCNWWWMGVGMGAGETGNGEWKVD